MNRVHEDEPRSIEVHLRERGSSRGGAVAHRLPGAVARLLAGAGAGAFRPGASAPEQLDHVLRDDPCPGVVRVDAVVGQQRGDVAVARGVRREGVAQ